MENYYYNLSGGINQASTKTELGLDTKKIYWTDSKNIEILQNKGIVRQNGNTKLFSLPIEEKITAIHQMKNFDEKKLICTTESGKIYIYSELNGNLTLLAKTLSSQNPVFADFLNGVVCTSKNDKLFFIKNDNTVVKTAENVNADGEEVKSNVIAIFKGRIWVAQGATIYYSALGKYDDFSTSDDAGYIANFHNDYDEIVAMKPYKEYLAIYKKNSVYLLSGTTGEDFAIQPFADKGATSSKGVLTVNNRQYFLNDGIFSLEQSGILNQIQLGSEITLNIRNEFQKFDKSRFSEVVALHYEKKHQVWYFIPYKNSTYLKTIWINDYVNKAWFKRVVPQNVVTATKFGDYIVTADESGNAYIEDLGKTFDGTAIDFMWKSAFIALGLPDIRKTIEEFYFVLDDSLENHFNFSVYKNYDSEYKDDLEEIYSTNFDNLVWNDEDAIVAQNFIWNDDDNLSLWATATESVFKAEISEANYSIQLCVEGNTKKQNVALIGLEFKEFYKED